MSGKALTRDMQQLMLKHGLQLTPLQFIRPVDDIDHVICVEGIASTASVDQERVKFAPYAFLPLGKVELRYDHTTPAGTVDDLHYEGSRLLVTATVTHARARRCQGLSVGCKVRDYVIRNAATADFHAEITRAELTEVSLVDTPVNAECRVTARRRLSPHAEFHHLMQAKVAVLQALIPIIGGQQHADRP